MYWSLMFRKARMLASLNVCPHSRLLKGDNWWMFRGSILSLPPPFFPTPPGDGALKGLLAERTVGEGALLDNMQLVVAVVVVGGAGCTRPGTRLWRGLLGRLFPMVHCALCV